MRIGIVVPQNEIGIDPTQISQWATDVQAAGFAYLDIFDHVVGGVDSHLHGPYTDEHAFHEPFVLYGFLAATVAIDLAIGVLVLPQRQTALVAKQAAEVDILCRGRLRLGVGIGWNPVEYQALGEVFANRADRFEEQVQVLRALWSERVIDYRGDHHHIERAGIAPLPVQRPIPLWLGGGPAAVVLERIGRLADGWVIRDPHPQRAVEPLAEIRRHAERAGRDPQTIGVQGRIDVHGTFDPDRFARSLQAWEDLGADYVSVHAHGQGGVDEHRALLSTVARLSADHLNPTDPVGGQPSRERSVR